VTGAPGSGKSTLGRELALRLRLPFVARDDVRGGLLFTAGAWTERLDRIPPGQEAVEAFLATVERLLASGVSCIVEYVVREGRPDDFDRITALGDCVVIMTSCDDPIGRVRDRNLADRLASNPVVLEAAGYSSVDEHTDAVIARMRLVIDEMRVCFPVPVLEVATDADDAPSLDDIVSFVTASVQ
jgi:hypothetical protein